MAARSTLEAAVSIPTIVARSLGSKISIENASTSGPERLTSTDRILIVDDFLATGKTIHALARIVRQAGAKLVGVACVVEKTFEGGREFLADLETQVEALAIIDKMTGDEIIFAE